MSISAPSSLIQTIASLQNQKVFAELSWQGTFEEYLALVRQNPSVTRTAVSSRARSRRPNCSMVIIAAALLPAGEPGPRTPDRWRRR